MPLNPVKLDWQNIAGGFIQPTGEQFCQSATFQIIVQIRFSWISISGRPGWAISPGSVRRWATTPVRGEVTVAKPREASAWARPASAAACWALAASKAAWA